MTEDLRTFIISRIRAGGPVTFARFMDWCLYHPVHGYYSAGTARIGKDGDYYTAPCVHPLFGGMVARQIGEMYRILGRDNFSLLEIGGGRGFLCADILAWLKDHDPMLYGCLDYSIAELSPSFRREQQDRLAGEAGRGKVRWISTDVLIRGELSLEGCILSNELVDALPVHRLRCEDGELKEILVDEEKGRFVERLSRLTDPPIAFHFAALGIKVAEGQTVELNLRALAWLEETARCLKRGFLITIDYGCRAEELYDPWRRDGTLRCFFRHGLNDSPYENLGKQDITSHVDFTSLIRKGEEIGLRYTGLVPQYRFLMAMGLIEEMTAVAKDRSPVAALQLRLSLKHLLDPERGMGEIFKVLIQHKGIEKPELRGLRDLRSISIPERSVKKMSEVKLLALYGSPRRSGNTEILVDEFLKGAAAEGAAIDRLYIGDHSITPCRECLACFEDGRCVIADDMEEIYLRLLAADIIVLASPVFFYGVSGWIKALIDRSQALWARKYVLKDPSLSKEGKKRKGFFISVGGTKGPRVFEGVKLTAKYFFDAVNAEYAGELLVREIDAKGDIMKQPEALNEAREAGKRLAAEAKAEKCQGAVNRN